MTEEYEEYEAECKSMDLHYRNCKLAEQDIYCKVCNEY